MATTDATRDPRSIDLFSEHGSLFSDFELDGEHEHAPMNRSQAWNLYVSHFLSTWNMRIYEFAAVCTMT